MTDQHQIDQLWDRLRTAEARGNHFQRERDRLDGLFRQIEDEPTAMVNVIRDQDGRIRAVDFPDQQKLQVSLAPAGATL